MGKIRMLNVLLSFILIMAVLMSPISGITAYAAAVFKGPSPVNGNLNKWILDEENGYIYTITDNKVLSFFDIKTLELKKEIKLAYLSDIDLYKGKLYAAMEVDKAVAVIDPKTAAVEKKITLNNNPHKIAIIDNKIFYVPRYFKGWDEEIVDFSKVYVHNLSDSKDTVAMSMTAIPGYENYSEDVEIIGLSADTAQNRLFVSARSVHFDSSYLFSISSKDYRVLDKGKSWTYQSGMFVNDRDVFFGSYRLDKEDLSKFYGNYDGNVAFAKDEYVYSNAGLFDRESFVKVGSFSEYDGQEGYPDGYRSFLVDSSNTVYMHGSYGSPIEKGALSSFIKSDPGAGNGIPSDPAAIEYNADKAGIETKVKRLNITKWLVDADSKLIYALSKENNSLMILSLSDLKLKKQIFIGKSPSYMALSGGKLYVALSDINQAAVVDLKTQAVEKNIILQHKPGALAVDGSKLFYMGYEPDSRTSEKFYKLYMYDLSQNNESDILGSLAKEFLESNMVLDAANHRLYLGHSTHDGAICISTADYKILGTSGYGRENYRSTVSADSTRVVYGYAGLDQNNISFIKGHFKEDIIYLKGTYAFSKNAVYDADSFEKLAELPFEAENIYMDSSGSVYLFDQSSNAISKFSLAPLIAGFPKAYDESIRNTDYSIPRNSIDELGRIMRNIETVLDEANDLIYVISPYNSKLQVVGAKDLKLKKELNIGQQPADLKLYKGKLYIAVNLTNSIVVYDTTSQKIIETYALSDRPDFFAVDDSKIYYQGSAGLHVYDLKTKQEKNFTFYDFKWGWDIYRVDRLITDVDNGILYGDSVEAKPKEGLYAINTAGMKAVRLPVAAEQHNDIDYEGMPLFRGNELMYGQTIYERDNPDKAKDVLKGRVLYTDDRIIITSYEMYLRKSRTKLGDMPEYYENMQVDNEKDVYVVMNREYYIKKTTIDALLAGLKNKTSAYDAYMKGELADVPKTEVKITFPDISNHWAREDIEQLAEKKVVNGIGGNFAPDKTVTRAEYVAMLARAVDPDGVEGVRKDIGEGNIYPYFADVKPKDWYYPSAIVARRIGLTLGDGKGNFLANTPITREQMAVMSLRALQFMNRQAIERDNEALKSFKDNGKVSKWAWQDASSAVKMGIINGTPGMLFAPQNIATRAEAAVVLKRIMDKF